jgi:RNA polymerase sigma-70 factor (ECF subfamily)
MSVSMHQQESLCDGATQQQTIVGSGLAGTAAWADELHLIELLRSGDEAAFVSLLDHYHTAMLRLAMVYVTARAVAEEVVQETWMAILEGLDRFERRSSLKTWMFRILTNRAKTRAQREGRSIPFSSLVDLDLDHPELAVEPGRFFSADQPWPGHWISFPVDWRGMPEECLLSQETRACIEQAIESLPSTQRTVIILRDIEGWASEEVCALLGLSEANQRVLLHRARSKVRGVLEKYFAEE